MSNFSCDKCGLPILEDENGDYCTGCLHYPLEELRAFNKKTKYVDYTVFKFPEILIRRYKDGEPCNHPGCLNHITHPCEGCGRIAGRG